MISNSIIVVTGGTGTVGQIIVSRLLSGMYGTPKKVIVFSRDEAKQYDMREKYKSNILEFVIGDIRNFRDVACVIRNADIIINTAAMKQVPSCELFPEQAVLTNVFGMMNIISAIKEHGLKINTVLNISTDKSCEPINVMGMTKAIQERIFIASNDSIPTSRFIGVRYGNVLRSKGSVIPLFEHQIKETKRITLTSSEATRFLLSIEKAVDCIFDAIHYAEPGEIYVPVIPSARIEDIAFLMAGKDHIDIIGMRPGEKMHEILLSTEESVRTRISDKYFIISPRGVKRNDFVYFEHPYNSEDTIMSIDELKNMLYDNGVELYENIV